MGEYNKQMQKFNVGDDCPVFEGLYEFCQLSAGGSVGRYWVFEGTSSASCLLVALLVGTGCLRARVLSAVCWWLLSVGVCMQLFVLILHDMVNQ